MLPEDLIAIRTELNNWNKNGEICVRSIELVLKSSVMHYQSKQGTFMKIYTTLPKYVSQLRTLFENGGYTYKKHPLFYHVTYESNLPYALRFMIDNEIVGMSWIRVNAGKYTVRSGK